MRNCRLVVVVVLTCVLGCDRKTSEPAPTPAPLVTPAPAKTEAPAQADSPAEKDTRAQKPLIKLAADGFPTGHETPEGVAADLARAFVNRDVALFESTCLRPFGGGDALKEYEAFWKESVEGIRQAATVKEVRDGDPQSIGKVFAARPLSLSGPASFGYAAFNFQEVLFTDVGVRLKGGGKFLQRTLVIKTDKGLWYVHPVPTCMPLLCAGLNEESDSVQDYAEVYRVK